MKPAALLVFGLTAAAGAAEPPPKQFTATPLAGSVSVLQGWECNNTVSAGDDGIVLVDTCGAKIADRLLGGKRNDA